MEFESVLKNVFSEEKLEELLVANWTHFLDSSRLLAFVLQTVQANINRLAIITSSEIKPKGVSVTLSRCHWTERGFVLWVEFHIPIAINKMAVGTMELYLSYNGSIKHINTLGNLFVA
jgi:hypothetical protein